MILSMEKLLRCVGYLGVLIVSGSVAAADTFPVKPIRFIVGFPPGGVVDIVARTVGPGIADSLGVQVVIDNRGGANGIIGTELVAKAAPDGYTIGLASISTMVLNIHLYRNLTYQLKDFTPLTTAGLVPFAIVVHPGVPAKSLKELIALARTKPGRLAFGSPGVGGLQHLTIEMLNSAAKIKVEHVPYKGTGPAMTDVLGGHIDGVVAGVSGILGSVKAGKLRAVALTGSERSSSLPELPTAVEQGLPGFVVVNWYAIVAPPNMPPALANTLHASIVKAVHSPAIAEKLVAAGVDPKTDASPAAFAQFVRDDFVRWGKIVKDSGIKAE